MLFIFFFSAFEPIHELPDWGLVYPELAGMVEEGEKPKGTITEQLDNMLEEAKIGPELIGSLGEGLRNLSDNTSKMTDLTDASIATSAYTDNVKQASESLASMKEASGQGSDILRELAGTSSDVKNNFADIAEASNQYGESMKKASSSLDEMNNSYGKAIGALDEISTTSASTRTYNEQMEKITNNLSSLNSMYELDLKESNKKLIDSINELSATSDATRSYTEQMQTVVQSLSALNSAYVNETEESNNRISAVKEFYGGITEVMQNLHSAAEDAKRNKEEIAQLGDRLAALNTVYGCLFKNKHI